MERQRFCEIRLGLRQASTHLPANPRCTHSDLTIACVLLWAILHDRAVSWACQPQHWPGDLRPRPLPTQSCVSRRQHTQEVATLGHHAEQRLREQLPEHDIKIIDARPLAVGGCSKDPEARKGYGAGLMQRGYKLHLLCDQAGAVDAWVLTPMNHSETQAATLLLEHARPATSHVLAGGEYDVNALYELAARRGVHLLALPRVKRARAPGHRVHHPERLANWAWMRSRQGQRTVRRVRSVIERVNGWQGMASIGLRDLPHHVRRLHRVRLWVAIKLLIYQHWLEHKQHARKSA